MDPAKILQIITNSTWMVTQLMMKKALQFSSTRYTLQLPENAPLGPIYQLSVQTPEEDNKVKYRILSGNELSHFSVEEEGKILLRRPLDYEIEKQHLLEVEASVKGIGNCTTLLVIKVDDVNDHAPYFQRGLHETQVTEEDDRDLPKAILTVSAQDADAGRFGHLQYSLSGDGVHVSNGTMGYFGIDEENGTIYLLKPLDRDPPHGRARWRLQVMATDSEFSASTSLNVNVKDINDNRPYFTVPIYRGTVPENWSKGIKVIVVKAIDNDDKTEWKHSRLRYSIERNVIDEVTQQPIFDVNRTTGEITTAICCLDREKSSSYVIQVVATDGGGLQGTGTVMVEVLDENDVRPKFVQSEWHIEAPETLTPDGDLAVLDIVDPDLVNEFVFRILPDSGRGWNLFRLSTAEGIQGITIKALHPLNYEDPEHRVPFRFKVEASDQNHPKWTDQNHVTSCWVEIQVVDENDNPPIFTEVLPSSIFTSSYTASLSLLEISIPEDIPTGTFIAKLKTSDADEKNKEMSPNCFIVPESDPWSAFTIDSSNSIRLASNLDRESAKSLQVHIVAVDNGEPRLSATLTLSVHVGDVNDNPPYLESPQLMRVQENEGPKEFARLRFSDPDDWNLGHGPPFSALLDEFSPPGILGSFEVTFDKEAQGGQGVAILRTLRKLDREKQKFFLIPILVLDSGTPQMSATVTVSVEIGDENDNLMKPSSKEVQVIMAAGQEGVAMIPLGRIYVEDPDDWDQLEKTYNYGAIPHPAFSLNTTSGALFMKPAAGLQEKHELKFLVGDMLRRQADVEAKVSVIVRHLSAKQLLQATPVLLNKSPQDLVTQSQNGDSKLSQFVRSTEVQLCHAYPSQWKKSCKLTLLSIEEPKDHQRMTRVWLSWQHDSELDMRILFIKENLVASEGFDIVRVGARSFLQESEEKCPRSCWTKVLPSDGYFLVDANSTSIIGPAFHIDSGCECHSEKSKVLSLQSSAIIGSQMCAKNVCHNGGRCLPTDDGYRCICPHGTFGLNCKILSRQFSEKDSGIWVPPFPADSDMHIALSFLSHSNEAILMYTGPSVLTHRQERAKDFLFLELVEGKLWLHFGIGHQTKLLKPRVHQSLGDGKWHRIDILWNKKGLHITTDACARNQSSILELKSGSAGHGTVKDFSHNSSNVSYSEPCRASLSLPEAASVLDIPFPLQLGGVSRDWVVFTAQDWMMGKVKRKSLEGCIKDVRINGVLQDLGDSVVPSNSEHPIAETFCCPSEHPVCWSPEMCTKATTEDECPMCSPGWKGTLCSQKTTSATFLEQSFVKVALPFTPLGYVTAVNLRFRTLEPAGELISLNSKDKKTGASLCLFEGFLCWTLQMDSQYVLCLSTRRLNDGQWHWVEALRSGSLFELSADEGEDKLFNASLHLPAQFSISIDTEKGIYIGGTPKQESKSSYTVTEDFKNGCIDDVRLWGRKIPLHSNSDPSLMGTVISSSNVDEHCLFSYQCQNVTCKPPLRCVESWARTKCRCPLGMQLSHDGTICQDRDECLWEPCLFGGTCSNTVSVLVTVCLVVRIRRKRNKRNRKNNSVEASPYRERSDNDISIMNSIRNTLELDILQSVESSSASTVVPCSTLLAKKKRRSKGHCATRMADLSNNHTSGSNCQFSHTQKL